MIRHTVSEHLESSTSFEMSFRNFPPWSTWLLPCSLPPFPVGSPRFRLTTVFIMDGSRMSKSLSKQSSSSSSLLSSSSLSLSSPSMFPPWQGCPPELHAAQPGNQPRRAKRGSRRPVVVLLEDAEHVVVVVVVVVVNRRC